MRHKTILLLSTFLVLPLAACQTTQSSNDKVNAALERAADQSAPAQSLPLLESMYKRDSTNPETALRYATALHDAARLNRALMVLTPFAESSKQKDNSPLLTEYASLQAETGNYEVAEDYARKAVLAAPDSGQPYQVLGIALDAQGKHQPAETAFRKALDKWQGDPVPVMNNLGLNLASQGFIDDALDMLRKAASLAPDRPEIERNLRIVTALQAPRPLAGWAAMPPHPKRKPAKDS